MLGKQDLVTYFEVHFGDYGLESVTNFQDLEFDKAGVVVASD